MTNDHTISIYHVAIPTQHLPNSNLSRSSSHSTRCSIMIAPPSTAETSKTLAKLLLYYNSLNKVTLLCKVSDWCVLFIFFKKIKNYKLVIRVAASSCNSIQPACAIMTVAVQQKIHCYVKDRGELFASLTVNKVWCEYRPRSSSFNMRFSMQSMMITPTSNARFKSEDELSHSMLLKKSMPLCRSSSGVARALKHGALSCRK